MKRFTFILTALLSALLLVIGCSKDNDGLDLNGKTEYYFKYRVDGTEVNYYLDLEIQINLTGGYSFDEDNQLYVIQLTGSKNIHDINKDQMVIYVNSTSEFMTDTTYSNTESADTVSPFYLIMGYFDENGENFVAGLNTPLTPLWEKVYLQFDEITDKGIKGTFSGKLLQYDSSAGQNVLVGEVEITSGEFYVPRNNEP